MIPFAERDRGSGVAGNLPAVAGGTWILCKDTWTEDPAGLEENAPDDPAGGMRPCSG